MMALPFKHRFSERIVADLPRFIRRCWRCLTVGRGAEHDCGLGKARVDRGDAARRAQCRSTGDDFYPGVELNGDKTKWWGLNEACVEALPRNEGFCNIEVGAHPTEPIFRGVFHAWRDTLLQIKPISESQRIKPAPSPIRRAIRKVRRLAGKSPFGELVVATRQLSALSAWKSSPRVF